MSLTSPLRRTLVAPLVALALVAPAPGSSDGTEPMRNEDVVRLLVAGSDVAEVLDAIRRRPPEYDLSPEMIDELKRVGVPDELIRAMREHQALADRTRRPEATTETDDPAAPPNVTVRLNPGSDRGPGSIRLQRAVDPQLAAVLELGNAPQDRQFAGIAVFLACTTPDHVPHQWRDRSPVGRDFISMPRHRMLDFVAHTASGDGSDRGRLQLDLPESLDANVERDVAHDLIVGIAAHVGGRYYRLAHDMRRAVIVQDDAVRLDARARGRGQGSLKIEFLDETD